MLSAAIRACAMRSLPTSLARSYTSKHGNIPKPNTNKPQHTHAWHEDLTTTSEASVKADHDTATMDEMRKNTVDSAQSHYYDPEAPTHATYARDQVDGPLGNAGVGEFEGVVGNDDLGPDDAQVESNGRVVTRRIVREKKTAREGEPGPG